MYSKCVQSKFNFDWSNIKIGWKRPISNCYFVLCSTLVKDQVIILLEIFKCIVQSVQAAVDHQLSDFAKSQPNTKISLVTFNNEVTVFGDGKNDAVVVTGDKLNDNDALVKVGTEASLPASIKETQGSLSSKLFRYNL